ncbi:hypothetical protein J6590_076100 [Homalodisca vitripennis]|nr:hypothetical protein J6590_076100 [Homalodisca vitripennis]
MTYFHNVFAIKDDATTFIYLNQTNKRSSRACRTLRPLSSVRSVPEVFSHTASVRSAQFSHFLSANLSSRQTVGLVARILCVGFFSAIKCDCAMSSSSGEETAVVALTLAAEEDDLG